jgi:hypothetical protein
MADAVSMLFLQIPLDLPVVGHYTVIRHLARPALRQVAVLTYGTVDTASGYMHSLFTS